MFKRHTHLVPVGFPTVLEGFVKAAMKKRPSNLGVFAWYYFMELIAYKAENENFDLSTLIREFHKNKADRISGNGFEEELGKKGYTVSSNVNHDFNELIINGELNWLLWDSTSKDNNNNNHAQVPTPSVSANSLDTNVTPGRAATETRHKVRSKGNEKKKVEKETPSEPLTLRKEADGSAQNGQNVSITNTGEKTRGKMNAGAAPFDPMKSAAVRRTKSAEVQKPRTMTPGDRASFHPVHNNPIRQIGAKQETKSTASGISGTATGDPSCTLQRERPLGSSRGATDPPPPNSTQPQPQHQLQPGQPPGIPYCHEPDPSCHHPPSPYGPPCEVHGWCAPGWCPPPYLPPYPCWPPPGPCAQGWDLPCACNMWPYLGSGEFVLTCPPCLCAPCQDPSTSCQSSPSKSTSPPDNAHMGNEQPCPGLPRCHYVPAFAPFPFWPGPMSQGDGGTPSSNASNGPFLYCPK